MTAHESARRADVNVAAKSLVDRLKANPDRYRVGVSTHASGATIIDAGIAVPGGLEAGRIISEICLGGLGTVTLRATNDFKRWQWNVDVHTGDPVTACLGSQYAGWSLSHGKGKDGFMALGSGPARAMGSKEELFKELGYRTPAGDTVMVLEVDKIPPVEIVEKVTSYCGITPAQLTFVLTPTSSLAGGVQVVARVLEVALHKVHELKFPLEAVVDGAGSAPVPPPHPDFIKAMGRTNDSILFGGQVHLYVDADDEAAQALVGKLPSNASKDFGKPFAKVFKEYNYDFYQIDPLLFSPARCSVTSVKSGKTYHAGELREDLLDLSFGP
ncbi:MAG: methenyltetrahydromethanopterin cyclohydrolase [Gammaproteobacteria bacterium]|nr:methenyltetrahydromethanopterin cyclohydrolase [Gammaproteobacteria bacterium]MBI5618869.1 methenyltetrahydromethanopterin cyclohydrolase [Gammaproteobacteria bacterium]